MLALRVTGVRQGRWIWRSMATSYASSWGTFGARWTLPQYLAGLQPTWAQVEGEYLQVAFEEP